MTIDERISFGYADTGNVTLHYATAGKGERLVVLLHGFPEFWYSWRHQLVDLSDKFTVVAPDMRGYNLSDRPPLKSDYDASEIAEDIVGLIRHLGREQAAVIGHDWGAFIAWTLAFEHPELIWRLGALQVPPVSVWRRNQTFRQYLASWYMFYFQIPAVPEFFASIRNYRMLEHALKTSTAKPGTFAKEDIAQYKSAWSQPGALSAMMNYYRANMFKRKFRSGEQKKIAVPTLFVYGEKDNAVLPSTVAGVCDIVSGPYTEHRIPTSAHWVQQEAHDEVTRVLRKFLED